MSIERATERHADTLGHDDALIERAIEDGHDPDDPDFDMDDYVEGLWVDSFEPPDPDDGPSDYGRYI